MTRPVKGFLSKRGRFFDKKDDAQICDAIEDFNEGLTEYLTQYLLPPLVQGFIMEHMKYFLTANRDIAEPYIKLVTELPPEPKVLVATAPVVPEQPFYLPEDVDDFLPEIEDDPPSTLTDAQTFADAFLDTTGSEGSTTDNDEDVRHARVPGEDPTE